MVRGFTPPPAAPSGSRTSPPITAPMPEKKPESDTILPPNYCQTIILRTALQRGDAQPRSRYRFLGVRRLAAAFYDRSDRPNFDRSTKGVGTILGPSVRFLHRLQSPSTLTVFHLHSIYYYSTTACVYILAYRERLVLGGGQSKHPPPAAPHPRLVPPYANPRRGLAGAEISNRHTLRLEIVVNPSKQPSAFISN